jgi:hypothetical protein
MRDLIWRMGLTLLVLTILAFLGLNVSCNSANHLLEQALGRTPQAQIVDYLAAIAEGNRREALALWSLPGRSNAALATRRQSVTDVLLTYGPRLEHHVLDVVWWRTCCEPGVISDPNEAGGARVRVAVRGESQPERIYVFGLLVPGGYWGAAAGYPLREWTIVDIYPEDAAPLAWTWR